MFKGWSNILTVICITVAGIVEAGEQALKDAPRIAAFFPAFLSGSFWHYIPLLFLIAAGVIWAIGRVVPSKQPTEGKTGMDWRDAFRNPRWEIVSDHRYHNDSVVVDGKSFRDCRFVNSKLLFHGIAPTEFIGTTQFEGSVELTTDNPAIIVFSTLQRALTKAPNARIEQGTLDAKGNILPERFSVQSVMGPSEQAQSLTTLPVYLDDLRVEVKCVRRGTTLDFSEATFLFKFSMVCDDDTGIREIEIMCTIGDRVYRGKPMADLSEWILRIPFDSPIYPYKSYEEKSLEAVSLWTELQQTGLKSGLTKVGYFGLHIAEQIPIQHVVSKVRLAVVRSSRREAYKFTFTEWPECEEQIFDRAFKQQ